MLSASAGQVGWREQPYLLLKQLLHVGIQYDQRRNSSLHLLLAIISIALLASNFFVRCVWMNDHGGISNRKQPVAGHLLVSQAAVASLLIFRCGVEEGAVKAA